MHNTKSIGIMYHFANEAKALLFKDRFKKIQLEISLFPCGHYPDRHIFNEQPQDYLIILVSDNLLKSSFCLDILDSIKLKGIDTVIIPILIDGVYINNENNKFVFEPTFIDLKEDVEDYVKYWHNKGKLLDLKISESQKELQKGLNKQKALVDKINYHFTDLIQFLKSNNIVSYDLMTKNNFKYLFERLNADDLFETYKRIVGFNALTNLEDTNKDSNKSKNPLHLSREDMSSLSDSKNFDRAIKDIELKMRSGDVGDILKDRLEKYRTEKLGENKNNLIYPEELLNFFEENPEKCINFLQTYKNKDDFESLEMILHTLIEEDIFNERLYFLAGEIYHLNKNYDKAYLHFKDSASLNPLQKGLYYKIALNYSKMKNINDKQLLKYWKKASKRNPTDIIVLKSYLHVLLKLGKYKKAERVLLTLHQLNPQNYGVLKKLSLVYTELNDFEKASYYSKMVKANKKLNKKKKSKHKSIDDVKEETFDKQDEIPDFIKDHLKGISKEEAPNLSDDDIIEGELLDDNSVNEDEIIDEFEDDDELDVAYDNDDFISDDEVNVEGIGDELDVLGDENLEEDYEKVCFITGATSGIGEATAIRFAENGYNIIITGRRVKKLKQLKKSIEEAFDVAVLALNYDVTDAQECKKAVKAALHKFGVIDVLINNAGLALGLSTFDKGDINQWNTMIDTNLKGVLFMSKYISKHMVKNGFGQIINVGSIAGKEVYPNGNVYCATKHAVVALTKAMRIDLHQHNIRVGSVNPGHVENTEFALVRFNNNAEKAKIYNEFKPLSSEDVADMIVYMCEVPAHINILDVVITSTQQASATIINKDGRNDI